MTIHKNLLFMLDTKRKPKQIEDNRTEIIPHMYLQYSIFRGAWKKPVKGFFQR